MADPLWRQFNPFGPVFDRELRASARRKRTYLLRLAYLGFLLLFLWGTYQSMRFWMNQPGLGAVARAQMLQTIGSQFLSTLVAFTLVAMMLTGPVLTCTAVGGERLAKTLPVLLATPLGAWSIVSGKLFSKVLTAFTLIVLSLPALAVARLLGGVENTDMLGGLATCAAVLVFTASLGLLLSVWVDRAYAVILLSFAAEFLLYAMAPLVIEELRAANPWAQWAQQHLWPLHPTATMIARLEQSRFSTYTDWWHSTWWPTILAHLALGALLLYASSLALRRAARRAEDRGAKSAQPVPALDSPLTGFGTSVPLPSSREPNVSDNPILWREWRRPLLAKRSHSIVGLLAVVGLLALVYYLGHQSRTNPAQLQTMYAVILTILGILLTSVLAATVIAQEKEGDTWTLLLAAPVSPAQVIWGKVAGVLRKLLWPFTVLCLHLTLFTATGALTAAAALWVLWVIVTSAALFLGAGVLFSLACKRTTTAVVLCLLLVVGLWLILPMIESLAFQANNGPVAIWLDPVFWVATGVEPLCKDPASQVRIPPFDHSISVRKFLFYGATLGLLSLATGLALLGLTQTHFDRLVRRSPSGGRAGPWRHRPRLVDPLPT